MKKLIILLENLTNKKIILEDSVFKGRRVDERLLPLEEKLKKHMKINEIDKTIWINLCIGYTECLVLEKYYKDYTIDVYGDVDIADENLRNLPEINFKTIYGYFDCAHNQLISLKYSPKEVIKSFCCSINKLTSLEYCPEKVGENFDCRVNSSKFIRNDIRKYCKVRGRMIV
jgi:hypothetical protein